MPVGTETSHAKKKKKELKGYAESGHTNMDVPTHIKGWSTFMMGQVSHKDISSIENEL